MNVNEERMHKFYTAFQQLDYKAMQDCYAEEVIFYDPVFETLINEELYAMWEMLCKNAKDFSLTFTNVEADEEYGTCNWVATYRFSKSNRKVVNKVKAHMRFKDGKIIEHTDQFNLWTWSEQALGFYGKLLGWSVFIQRKIRNSAQNNLADYMNNHYGERK
jgi:ketosteroid isomerase-like protein